MVVSNYKPKIDIDPAWEMVELGGVSCRPFVTTWEMNFQYLSCRPFATIKQYTLLIENLKNPCAAITEFINNQ